MKAVNAYREPQKVALLLSSYNYQLHCGIVEYASNAGWLLDDTMTREGHIPRDWHGDGIISLHAENPAIISKIIAEKVPTVDLGAPTGSLSLPCVLHNNKEIATMAGKHLSEQGYLNFGYVISSNNLNDQERIRALKEFCGENEINFFTLHEGRILQDLKGVEKPIGLMVEDDYKSMMMVHKCLRNGYSIPGEVGVISVGNNELYCQQSPVTITSIDSDLFEIGYQAAKKLDEMMSGQSALKHTRVSPKGIIKRGSTNVMAVSHPKVAFALKFIQKNYCSNIDFEKLADDSGMCRRRLDDAFKRHIGRTMYEEHLKRRLDFAQRLLVDSNEKMYDIAEKAGFANASHMTRLFKQHLDLTPKQVRNMKLAHS